MPDTPVVRLAAATPVHWPALLAFYARRAIPGVETVGEAGYRRVFALHGQVGHFQVQPGTDASTLELRICHPDPAAAIEVQRRVRGLFDLDAERAAIDRCLRRDLRLRPRLKLHPDVRVPGCWDGFELGVRAVLGQQVTVAAARTLAARIVARHGQAVATLTGSAGDALFPSAATLAEADLDQLGLTRARAETVRALARAVASGALHFDPAQSLDEFVARCVAIRGIGDWTAHYMAMRALRQADAFPAGDIVLRKVLQPGQTLSTAALERQSAAWRPFRAYAVLLLWRSAG